MTITFADERRYSWVGMHDALETGEAHPAWGLQASKDYAASAQWDCGFGWDRALALARGEEHWPEGEREIEELAREQAGKYILKRPLQEYYPDVTGAYYDMASVCTGRPDCWLAPMPDPAGSELGLIRLVVDLGASAGVDAAVIIERTRAVMACALTLEYTSAAVEVILANTSWDSDNDAASYCQTIQVNNAGEPIDTRRLIAAAHPSFLRRVIFRLIELTPVEATAKRYSSGYGHVSTLPPDTLRAMFGERVVYIPPARLGQPLTPTVEALMALVKQRLGCIGTDDAEEQS